MKKAVIPAAGLGIRMRPLSSYLPKAMLPLGKKPVIQYVVEELKGAGITEIAIVIRTENESVVEYFGGDDAICFIYDDSASGPGGAVLKAESFTEGEDFLVVFADAPVLGPDPSDYLTKLRSVKNETNARAVLSIYKIAPSEISSRGIVILENEISEDKAVQLTDILEKPSKEKTLSGWASACRYIFDAGIFEALKNCGLDKDGELQLTSAIRKLIQNRKRVVGYPLKERLQRYDTGNFEGYFQAFADFTSGYNGGHDK